MTVSFGGRVEGLDEVLRRFRKAPEKFERYMRKFLQQAVIIVERAVKLAITQKKAVNTGALRASITHSVEGSGARMKGIVGSPLKYAVFVEEDTRAHFPPRRPIIAWAMRKLKLRGLALRTAVRGIIWKIGRRGTTGRHMFADAFTETQGKVRELWGEVWGDAVRREL